MNLDGYSCQVFGRQRGRSTSESPAVDSRSSEKGPGRQEKGLRNLGVQNYAAEISSGCLGVGAAGVGVLGHHGLPGKPKNNIQKLQQIMQSYFMI